MSISNELVDQLKTIMSNDDLTWEQKHNKIFYDGLKTEIVNEAGGNEVTSGYISKSACDKTECESFYEWVLANVSSEYIR
jgi:hypothetical protein